MKVLVPAIFLVLLRWSEAASSPFDKFDATKGGVIELRFPDGKAEVSLVSLSNFFETVVINGTIHSVAKIADSKSAAVVKTKSGKSIQTDCKEEKEDDQIRELCSINVVKGTSTAEIFNALLKEASKKTKAFGGVEVKAESAEAADAILNALASNEISVKHLELYYGKAVKPNEKSLLTLVKASKLSQIYAEAPAWKVTDEFFQNEGIQKLGSIELKVAESQIKDKTIAKFNGDPSLQLGKTPNLTQGGVRAFLQPVFNYKSHGRLLVISPKFKLNDKALLKGRKFKQALETKNPGSVTRNLDVQVGRARPAGLSITTEGESLSFSVVADT